VTRNAIGYCVINNVFYWWSTSTPLLKCLSLEENTCVLREIHESICGLHTGSRALAA